MDLTHEQWVNLPKQAQEEYKWRFSSRAAPTIAEILLGTIALILTAIFIGIVALRNPTVAASAGKDLVLLITGTVWITLIGPSVMRAWQVHKFKKNWCVR